MDVGAEHALGGGGVAHHHPSEQDQIALFNCLDLHQMSSDSGDRQYKWRTCPGGTWWTSARSTRWVVGALRSTRPQSIEIYIQICIYIYVYIYIYIYLDIYIIIYVYIYTYISPESDERQYK